MNEIQIRQPKGTDSFETFLLAAGKVVLQLGEWCFKRSFSAKEAPSDLCGVDCLSRSGYTEGSQLKILG